MKEPSKIKISDSWNQFLTTGSVADYLNYVSGGGADRFKDSKTDWVGDSPHAGIYTSDRNNIETDAYR